MSVGRHNTLSHSCRWTHGPSIGNEHHTEEKEEAGRKEKEVWLV